MSIHFTRADGSRGRIAISRVCLCVSMCVCPRDRLTQKWMIQKCLNFVPGMTLGYPRNGMVLSQRSKVKVRVLARKVVLWIKVTVVWLRWDESILSGVHVLYMVKSIYTWEQNLEERHMSSCGRIGWEDSLGQSHKLGTTMRDEWWEYRGQWCQRPRISREDRDKIICVSQSH